MSNFRRLFGEHLGITLLFGFFWFVFTSMAMIGPEDPRDLNLGLVLVLLTIPTVLVSFAWANSKYYHQVESVLKRRTLVWGTAIADFIVLAVLLLLPAMVVVPQFGNYGTRAKMSQMIAPVISIKTEITLELQEHGKLVGLAQKTGIGKPRHADYALLSPDGTIVLYNERHGALLVMTPTLSGKDVTWRCQGYPPKLFPAACRDGTR